MHRSAVKPHREKNKQMLNRLEVELFKLINADEDEPFKYRGSFLSFFLRTSEGDDIVGCASGISSVTAVGVIGSGENRFFFTWKDCLILDQKQ